MLIAQLNITEITLYTERKGNTVRRNQKNYLVKNVEYIKHIAFFVVTW